MCLTLCHRGRERLIEAVEVVPQIKFGSMPPLSDHSLRQPVLSDKVGLKALRARPLQNRMIIK